jgi:hypothetical protein
MNPISSCVLVALLIGCRPSAEDVANGPDPLRALAQHVESSRYGPDYWKDVAGRNPALWAKATAFCRRGDSDECPTCASVKMVEFLEGNTQPAAPADSFSFRSDRKRDSAVTDPVP